jgi:hypothetical protein
VIQLPYAFFPSHYACSNELIVRVTMIAYALIVKLDLRICRIHDTSGAYLIVAVHFNSPQYSQNSILVLSMRRIPSKRGSSLKETSRTTLTYCVPQPCQRDDTRRCFTRKLSNLSAEIYPLYSFTFLKRTHFSRSNRLIMLAGFPATTQ